jgi:hypothetical protein
VTSQAHRHNMSQNSLLTYGTWEENIYPNRTFRYDVFISKKTDKNHLSDNFCLIPKTSFGQQLKLIISTLNWK